MSKLLESLKAILATEEGKALVLDAAKEAGANFARPRTRSNRESLVPLVVGGVEIETEFGGVTAPALALIEALATYFAESRPSVRIEVKRASELGFFDGSLKLVAVERLTSAGLTFTLNRVSAREFPRFKAAVEAAGLGKALEGRPDNGNYYVTTNVPAEVVRFVEVVREFYPPKA